MAGTKRVVQSLDISWREEAVIDSRYRLNKLIGRGGFGEVWRAHPVKKPQQTVAIKRLLQVAASGRRRFQLEKHALKQLYRNENVVTVYDSGEYLGQDYLVLEHVAGGTLKSWLEVHRQGRQQGLPLPSLRGVLDLIGQICNGLQAAHELSIVHRDLKPDNIMLLPTGPEQWRVKVLDFGVARIGKRVDTLTSDRMGTYGYMAPEQSSGGADVGPASDVFAIGVLCIELLTLHPNSPNGDPHACFAVQHPDQLQRFLRDQRRDIPGEFWNVIARSLHFQAKERYPNAGALWRAIEASLALPGRTP